MIKAKRKIISVLIAIAMVCTSFLSYIPANVKAAPESGRKWKIGRASCRERVF